MDDALRALERRGDDQVALCLALRRAGRDVEARRTLEAAVRGGDVNARAALDELWPLDERERELLDEALGPGSRRWSLVELVGDEDPRLESSMREIASAAVRRTEGRAHGRAEADILRLCEVAALPAELRRARLLALAGDGLPESTLCRARLDAAESSELFRRAWAHDSHAPDERGQGGWPLVLIALSQVERARPLNVVELLGEVVAWPHQALAAEAWYALAAQGVAPVDVPMAGLLRLPWRPTWHVAAGTRRDALTGAWRRDTWWVRAVSGPGWVMCVDLDRTKHLNVTHGHQLVDSVLTAVSRCLQGGVGDRVCRWRGDQWLVRLEPELDGLAVAEGLRQAVETLDVPEAPGLRITVTIGVARAASWIDAVKPAEEAMYAGKQSKDPRNCVRSA